MLVLRSYFLRAYWKTALFVTAICVFVLLIAKLTEVTDDFVRYEGPKADIVDYLAKLIPAYLLTQLPAVAFATAAFHAAYFSTTREFLALWAAGESFGKILRPLLILTPVWCTGIFFFADFIAIPSNSDARYLFDKITGRKGENKENQPKSEHLFFPDADLFIGAYVPGTGSAREILLERKLPDDLRENSYCKSMKLIANGASLLDCRVIMINTRDNSVRVTEKVKIEFSQPQLRQMLGFTVRPLNELTISGLWELRQQNLFRGQPDEPVLSELFVRFTFPLFFPLAFTLGLLTGIRFATIGTAGLIFSTGIYAGSFYGINQSFRSLAGLGLIPPLFAALIPFIAQCFFTLFYLRRHPV